MVKSLQHWGTKGHWPDWIGHSGLLVCKRCIRGKSKRDPLVIRRPAAYGWGF